MSKPKFLLIGWDAADWDVLHPMLDAGEMPHLAKLIERGVIGNLATLRPPYSPMLWTSIATGMRPTKHGIHGFSEPAPDGLGSQPVSGASRKVKALWNILTQQEKNSIVVGWYPSNPAEPIRGVMVADFYCKPGDADPPAPGLPIMVHPREKAAELEELRVSAPQVMPQMLAMLAKDWHKIDQKTDRRVYSLAKVIAENLTVHSIATELMETEDWDFAAIFYDGIDHFSHGFMAYHPPKLPWISDDDFEIFQDVIKNAYRWHDMMLGRLLDLAGPDVTVMLCSDHGFESGQSRRPEPPVEMAGPTHDHRHFGIVVMAGPGIKKDERVYGASLLDIAPTMLHLMGLPVGQDMDGKVLLTAMENPAPIQRIPSWEAVPGACGMHPADLIIDPLASAEAMKQLVALGYVAPPPDDAAQAAKEAVIELRYGLAQAYDDENRPDMSLPLYREMLELSPGDHRAVQHLVSVLINLGDLDAARAELEAFDVFAEENATASRAEFERRESEKPRADFAKPAKPAEQREMMERRKLLQHASGYRPLREMLHLRIEFAEDRIDDAFARLERLTQPDENGVAMMVPPMLIANLCQRAGKLDEARAWCEKAIEHDPQDCEALSLSASLAIQTGDWERVVDRAAASLGLIYFQPNAHLMLGLAFQKLGEPAQAAASMRVAILQAPGFVAAHLALAELYESDLQSPENATWHRSRAITLQGMQSIRAKTAAETVEQAEPPANDRPRPVFARRDVEVDPAQIVTIVTGLPRSGTSMLMQALQAGGVAALTDNIRQPDSDNPRGYLEFEPAIRLQTDRSWLPQARGKAVKLVPSLLRYLPPGESYRVVVIQRELADVTASQTRMLERLERMDQAGKLDARSLTAEYLRQEALALMWLDRHPRVAVLPVRYEEMLADPQGNAALLADFLGHGFSADACAAAIDPSLRRQNNSAA